MAKGTGMSDTIAILEDIFCEKKNVVLRGRQEGPRRPSRSEKSGYKDRGYSGPGGKMAGRDADDGDDEKKKGDSDEITEFDNLDDWVLSMILVALMHANPELSPNDAIEEGKKWSRKLYMPRMNNLWRRQTSRIKRYGIRAEASKIRRELFKML